MSVIPLINIPGLAKNEDSSINLCVMQGDVSQLKENVVAVDATYYLSRIFELHPEPLTTALGGPLAIETHIQADLNKWKANDTTPYFIFDGCPVKGHDEVALDTGRLANTGTDGAWEHYANGEPDPAVARFGEYTGAYCIQTLYPILQAILKKNGHHFLVPPFKAAAQIAYFSKNETVCGAIMGSRELLLYPIKDPLIEDIDWDTGRFKAVLRDNLMSQLSLQSGLDESLFVDALLITGCSFLPAFPAKAQPQLPCNSVRDAVNMLRANGKHVKQLCNFYDDSLKNQPDWFDKFCKARMIVKHFIYINENGAVEVENYDELTGDSHEYLGIRLPEELLHYLNTGLIGPRILSWITHSKLTILPTLDGIASEEYKNLVVNELLPSRELSLGLVVPRLNRGLHYKDIEVKTWFSDLSPIAIRNSNFRTPSPKVATWDIEEKVVQQQYPSWSLSAPAVKDRAGSLAFEVLSLRKAEFAKDTVSKPGNKVKANAPAHLISSVIWRFLHLRDYVNDSHELTPWGKALAKAMTELEPTVKKNPKVPGLYEALLLGFELIRYDQLNAKPRQDEAARGEVESSLLLLSRSAVLLKLRHEAIGYTGPLRKDTLSYLSQVSAVREAGRDLVDAIVAHMFLNNKTEKMREPGEYWDISNANHNDAMGVAIRTYFEMLETSQEFRDIDKFSNQYFPKAEAFRDDIDIFRDFFNALTAGVQTLDLKDMSSKDTWSKANKYLLDQM